MDKRKREDQERMIETKEWNSGKKSVKKERKKERKKENEQWVKERKNIKNEWK